MRVHLAIFRQPYLNLILALRKTIELRLTMHRILPFEGIAIDDKIFLKESGKKIVGQAFCAKTLFKKLESPSQISKITEQYPQELRIEQGFLEAKLQCKYLSLIWLRDVTRIDPLPFVKHDQRTWLILDQNTLLDRYIKVKGE